MIFEIAQEDGNNNGGGQLGGRRHNNEKEILQMAPVLCNHCHVVRAVVKRPKNLEKLCRDCFLRVFEEEVHHTIVESRLFRAGDKIAIGASGGKDSTVLASIMKTLNERFGYGLQLCLLSIDEGIKGYRDDSLETVKRNSKQYDLPLHILGYDELYGWTMDQVVETIGKRGNCTYCGVFRRQALDRGAKMLGINHLVTGHNADDMAETVMMNLLRGDLPRLARGTLTMTGSATNDVRRSKPLKYSYEKEIVLYAHHKRLDYFSTECIYSPEAFRGSARTLIKSLERVRPSIILDIVRSGEDMAGLVLDISPMTACAETRLRTDTPPPQLQIDHPAIPNQATGNGASEGVKNTALEVDMTASFVKPHQLPQDPNWVNFNALGPGASAAKPKPTTESLAPGRNLGSCVKCGYMSSQSICQACRLLDILNKTTI